MELVRNPPDHWDYKAIKKEYERIKGIADSVEKMKHTVVQGLSQADNMTYLTQLNRIDQNIKKTRKNLEEVKTWLHSKET